MDEATTNTTRTVNPDQHALGRFEVWGGNRIVTTDRPPILIAEVLGRSASEGQERANRICAALNACQGIPTDVLEAAGSLPVIEALKVNQELLDACKELADLMEDAASGEYRPDSFTTQAARKAIALAEGKS